MVIPYIVDGLGERNIVTFRENLTEILREHYSKLAECKTKEQKSSMVIIEAAAKIIKVTSKQISNQTLTHTLNRLSSTTHTA